jgi:hypothetical protein
VGISPPSTGGKCLGRLDACSSHRRSIEGDNGTKLLFWDFLRWGTHNLQCTAYIYMCTYMRTYIYMIICFCNLCIPSFSKILWFTRLKCWVFFGSPSHNHHVRRLRLVVARYLTHIIYSCFVATSHVWSVNPKIMLVKSQFMSLKYSSMTIYLAKL